MIAGVAMIALAATITHMPASQGIVQDSYYFDGSIGSTPNSIYEVSPGKFIGNTVNTPTGLGSTVFSVTSTGAASLVYQAPAGFEIGTILPTMNGQLFGNGGLPSGNNFITITRKGTNLKDYPLGISVTLDGQPFYVPSPSGELYTVMGITQTQYEIVKVAFDGKITVLHTFAASEGTPDRYSGIALSPEGDFYGSNDIYNNGIPSAYLYKLSHTGTFTKLLTLPGGNAGLVTAPDGTVYGALANGGPNQTGSIYKISPTTGQFTTLATFPKTGMTRPGTLVLADDRNLYGSTTSLPSYFFRLNLVTNHLEDLAGALYSESCDFTCPMLQGSDGKIYGVSQDGGSGGGGLFFSIDAGLPPPKPKIFLFSPTQGTAGTVVELWGSNLLGATSVTFNGMAATSVVATTSQSVFVHVPAGATSGPISITTPNGSFTTQQDFTVQ